MVQMSCDEIGSKWGLQINLAVQLGGQYKNDGHLHLSLIDCHVALNLNERSRGLSLIIRGGKFATIGSLA